MDPLTVAVRLSFALLLGCLIGFERQWNQKVAGLRTNSLVALGAAGFVTLSVLLGNGDPTRIAAQVVSGIGFLGAGVILREGVNVHGLTTAATLWCSAMVGTLAGAGFLPVATMAATLVVGANIALRPVVRYLSRREIGVLDIETIYSVHLTCRSAGASRVRAAVFAKLKDSGLFIRQVKSETIQGVDAIRIIARAVSPQRRDSDLEVITSALSADEDVTAAMWRSSRANPDV